jgi:tryptophanyl-tRNA synthetase
MLNSSKIRVFSGTRATGRLHLGNYFGAVKGYIDLQNDPKYDCIYMAVDVHTITTPYDHLTLAQATKEIIMDYLAAGLDPEKAVVTIQSLVPEHVELAFLFASIVSVAKMQHLPTFKDKVKQHPDNVTMALLNYPTLMAADILAYKTELVPAGLDQEPHIEVTREIARRMNDLYGTDFPETKRFATPAQYVPSLTGEGKMSKSVEGSSINLTDDLATIKKRLASCPTDSGKGSMIPEKGGVSNLLTFVEIFQGNERKKAYEADYFGNGLRYGDLKAELAEAIFNYLEPIRTKRLELEKNPDYVNKIIKEGAEKARAIASVTLAETKRKMGFYV